MNVKTISNEACFSKFHFIRIFRATYGRTPHEHLVHCRVERAKALLSDGVPVADACYAVGFSSTSSFSRLFKRASGRTPAVFREAALSRLRAVRSTPLSFVPACFSSAHGWRAE